ncbi:hypothetical protein BDZ45DRAFT_146857 [Acephala macrosclerotiorum]|nr:hypothetical protein BDZ45DRAFT_146857 [Acephala macrosclerotiorum]
MSCITRNLSPCKDPDHNPAIHCRRMVCYHKHTWTSVPGSKETLKDVEVISSKGTHGIASDALRCVRSFDDRHRPLLSDSVPYDEACLRDGITGLLLQESKDQLGIGNLITIGGIRSNVVGDGIGLGHNDGSLRRRTIGDNCCMIFNITACWQVLTLGGEHAICPITGSQIDTDLGRRRQRLYVQ